MVSFDCFAELASFVALLQSSIPAFEISGIEITNCLDFFVDRFFDITLGGKISLKGPRRIDKLSRKSSTKTLKFFRTFPKPCRLYRKEFAD